MKVRIEYTTEVGDEFRRAINLHYGKPGLASRDDVKQWIIMHGNSQDDDLMYDLQRAIEDGEEPAFPQNGGGRMIRAILNLRCPDGHRHYSPTPEVFVGRTCMAALERNPDGSVSKKKCQQPLAKLAPPKPIYWPEPDGQRVDGGRIIPTNR